MTTTFANNMSNPVSVRSGSYTVPMFHAGRIDAERVRFPGTFHHAIHTFSIPTILVIAMRPDSAYA
jgi:hypothetical protein